MEELLLCSSTKRQLQLYLTITPPVALTSHCMKVLERLVLVSTFLDPLQLAYCRKVGVKNAIIYLLQQDHSHPDKAGSTDRIMFFDFLVHSTACSLHCRDESLKQCS